MQRCTKLGATDNRSEQLMARTWSKGTCLNLETAYQRQKNKTKLIFSIILFIMTSNDTYNNNTVTRTRVRACAEDPRTCCARRHKIRDVRQILHVALVEIPEERGALREM